MYKKWSIIVIISLLPCLALGKYRTGSNVVISKSTNIIDTQYNKSGFVTAIITPAIKYVDWSSPSSLIKSFGMGGLKKSLAKGLLHLKGIAMGHGMAEVTCIGTDGRKHDFWTGMAD